MPVSLPQKSASTLSDEFDRHFQALPLELRLDVLSHLPNETLAVLAEGRPPVSSEYHQDLMAACDKTLSQELRLFWPSTTMTADARFEYFAQASRNDWHRGPIEVTYGKRPQKNCTRNPHQIFLGRVPVLLPSYELAVWELDVCNRNLRRAPVGDDKAWRTRLGQATALVGQRRFDEASSLIERLWKESGESVGTQIALVERAILNNDLPLLKKYFREVKKYAPLNVSLCDGRLILICLKSLNFDAAAVLLGRVRELSEGLSYLNSADFGRSLDQIVWCLFFRREEPDFDIEPDDAHHFLNFLQQENIGNFAQSFLVERLYERNDDGDSSDASL